MPARAYYGPRAFPAIALKRQARHRSLVPRATGPVCRDKALFWVCKVNKGDAFWAPRSLPRDLHRGRCGGVRKSETESVHRGARIYLDKVHLGAVPKEILCLFSCG